MIIPTQPSESGLPGHLDFDYPYDAHAINNLLVQKLGRDEVVATVHDDGDVGVILVRHVVHAIKTRISSGTTEDLTADNVKPIFQRNVGISAWGLAIHSQARVIAVSSNNHEVTVFRFGLVDEPTTPRGFRRKGRRREQRRDEANLSPDEPLFTPSAQTPPGDAGEDVSRPARTTDVTRQVLNGEANIPHIAFCNTGDDPDAKWLLTTDISGICRVMDLDRFRLTQAFRFGPSFALGSQGQHDPINAGWGMMFLDKRSFIPGPTLEAALGLGKGESVPDLKTDVRVWDLSKTLRHLDDVSKAFVQPKKKDSRQSTPSRSRSMSQRTSEVSSPLAAARATSIDSTGEGEEVGGVSLLQEEDEGDSSTLLPSSPPPEPDPEPEDTSDPDLEMFDDFEDDSDAGEPTEDFINPANFYSGERICGNLPSFVRGDNICEDLPCPILHASIRNIYLMQPSNQKQGGGPFSPPFIGLAAPLKQKVQAGYAGLSRMDRLNMHAYIPSIGVVVLASQKGRAIVLSLSKVPTSVRYPSEMEALGSKSNYAMRVECILPYESQEKAGQRPFTPLHGIAVGPIQGSERGGEERKRWRLMMMYQDHSVLSYEIRRKEMQEVDVGLASLVI